MAFKEDFKKGCTDAGGRWVENSDGTYTCHIGDVHIKCGGDPPHCHLAAELAPEDDGHLGVRADLVRAVVALMPPKKHSPKS